MIEKPIRTSNFLSDDRRYRANPGLASFTWVLLTEAGFSLLLAPGSLAAEVIRVVGGAAPNHRYGNVVCDLERRRIIALLRDREVATVQAWLADHPAIEVVSRDRGGAYGEAAAKALPQAMQEDEEWKPGFMLLILFANQSDTSSQRHQK